MPRGNMNNAHQEVERLLTQIRTAAHNPVIERATDQISALCKAYMEPTEDLPGAEYNLTPGEAKVFAMLLKRRGMTCSKEALLTACSLNDEAEIKMVDVRICTLRRKLARAEYNIETVWGVGYRLTPATEAKMAA